MSVFQYSAANRPQGTIAADSPRHARKQLRSQGVAVEQLHPQSSETSQRFRRRSASAPKLTTTTRELATLLSAGIGLVEALEVLTKQHRGALDEHRLFAVTCPGCREETKMPQKFLARRVKCRCGNKFTIAEEKGTGVFLRRGGLVRMSAQHV